MDGLPLVWDARFKMVPVLSADAPAAIQHGDAGDCRADSHADQEVFYGILRSMIVWRGMDPIPRPGHSRHGANCNGGQ